MTRRARSAVLAVAVALAVATALPALAATHHKTVKIHDFGFSPTRLTVQRDTKVRWVWKSMLTHNVTLIKGPHGVRHFHSANLSGGSYSHILRRRGTYTFECTIHFFKMKIKVV